MRCLTLADALANSGWTCAFTCAESSFSTIPLLTESQYEALTLGEGEGREAADMADRWPAGCDWLVVDHYERDYRFEGACRPWAKHILVIDDLADRRHDCDLLIDQTLGRREDDYRLLVPDVCDLMMGAEFALLRPQFAEMRRRSLQRRNATDGVKRILVSLGASDPHGLSRLVLDGVAGSSVDVEVDVVLGSGAEFDVVHGLARQSPLDVRVHSDVRNMATLMAEADLAVGAAGTSSWERCCLGLPSLIVITADNQSLIASALMEAGAAKLLGRWDVLTSAMVAKGIRGLAEDIRSCREMSDRASRVCDGKGAKRVAERLAA
jgi:UDP-2,4-diacetamido-2,4,6-trideoxy-beta-L-altropyranose hydrolase